MAEETQVKLGLLAAPHFYKDGNMIGAVYGPDWVGGVAGYGPTPADALREFERLWLSDEEWMIPYRDQAIEWVAEQIATGATTAPETELASIGYGHPESPIYLETDMKTRQTQYRIRGGDSYGGATFSR
jgi:hypothetical protein